MGGYFSGRRFGSKAKTSYYCSLDIRRLRRSGVLEPGCMLTARWSRNGEVTDSIQIRSEQDRVWLIYRHRQNDDSWKRENYPVTLQRTPCHYGGSRPWFLCPASGCGRRVAVLYGGEIFACRHCYRLAYDSQNEPPHYRALRRVLFEDFPEKPRGMHWRTYARLSAEAEEAKYQSLPPWFLKQVLRDVLRGHAAT